MATMTPRQILEAYAEAVIGLERLRYIAKRDGGQLELLTEAEIRAYQSLFALARFRSIETSEKQRAKVECADLSDRVRTTLERPLGSPELQFYAEAFYQCAFRLRDLLKQIRGFKRFEAAGVRDTRNWLIQHSEKSRGVLSQNYAYDVKEGFVLKPFGGSPGARPRPGHLYPDAEEFIRALHYFLAKKREEG